MHGNRREDDAVDSLLELFTFCPPPLLYTFTMGVTEYTAVQLEEERSDDSIDINEILAQRRSKWSLDTTNVSHYILSASCIILSLSLFYFTTRPQQRLPFASPLIAPTYEPSDILFAQLYRHRPSFWVTRESETGAYFASERVARPALTS